MDLYAENILDHYRHPRNKFPLLRRGKGQAEGAEIISHEETNLSCGDSLEIDLTISDRRIAAIGWNGDGCAISQAAMSMLSEEIVGKTPEEVQSLKKENVYELLGVPVGPRRFKCALLGLHTLINAVRKSKNEPAQGWAETAGESL